MDTSKLRLVLESALSQFDAEDDEDLGENLVDEFASGLRVVQTSRAGSNYRSALFLVGPMYASETLSSYAGYMTSLEPAGIRIHHAIVVDRRGRIITEFRRGERDLAVPLNCKADVIADKWLTDQRLQSGLALTAVKPLADPFAGEDVRVAKALLKSLEPIIHFSSRTVAIKIRKQRIAAVESALAESVSLLSDQALSTISERMSEIVNREALSLASRSSNPAIGTYNYLVAEPAAGINPEWAKRNREQSLTALANLTGLLSDYNEGSVLSNDLRDSIDSGAKTADFIASRFNARPPSVKAFLSSSLGDLGKGSRIDRAWISEYFQIAEAVPPMRIPTKERDINIAREMIKGHDQLVDLARSTHSGDHRTLWEGVLKNGWEQACELMMKIYHHNIPESESDRWRLAGVVLEQVASVVRDIDQIVDLGKRVGILNQNLNAQLIKTSYLKDKTIKAIGELRGVLITMKNEAEAKHIEILGLGPSDQEWSPLLKKRSIEINGVSFTELVSRRALQEQSDEIINCVHGYGPACLNSGSRIFSVRSKGKVDGHFSTLETRISEDCLSLSIRQHTSYRNRAVCLENDEAARLLVNGINDGSIEADMSGYRRDRVSGRAFGSSNIEDVKLAADKAMYKHLSSGISCLLPRSARGMSIEAYLTSDLFQQERPAVEKHLAKLKGYDEEQMKTNSVDSALGYELNSGAL